MSQTTVMFHDLFAHNARSFPRGPGSFPCFPAWRSARKGEGKGDISGWVCPTHYGPHRTIPICHLPVKLYLYLVNGRQSIPLTVYNEMVNSHGIDSLPFSIACN